LYSAASLPWWSAVFSRGARRAAQEAQREEPIKPPLRVKLTEHGEPVITLDEEAQHAIGLKLAELSAGKYQDQVRGYGTVLDLATLTNLNTTYVSAVSQLNTARARLAASQPAFARAQSLYAKSIGNLVQVQATEATLLADRAAVEAAESQVRTLRATAMQEWGPVIGNSLVVDGGLITRLIERTEFLQQITLPPGVRIDDVPATASVEVGGSSRRADVRYISPATRADPRIQGLSYFYAAGASSGVLPGMNVRAFLANGAPVDGVVIPASAVVWWAGRAWVYRRTGDDTFSRREIPTDMPAEMDAGFIVPASLFKPQEEMVGTGAQMLLSEEFRSQIQVGGDD
ncbi:MAG: efflux RND transporter periplasmic adaptor subunit, partial [Hyphomicrobium sp.]